MNQFGSKPNILIVDDEPDNIRVLASRLKDHYTIIAATNGQKALEQAAAENRPDLILLDIMMPDMDGYEICRRLKADQRTHDIPVIFITALDAVEDETAGFEVGGVDYITKPIKPAVLEARVGMHLELKQHRDYLEDLVKGRTHDLRLRTLDLEEEIRYRKRIEEILRASESKLTSIIDAFKGFIYTVGARDHYRIDFMNQTFIDHIGHDGTGEPCYKVMGFDAPCTFCEIEKVYKGEIVETEFEQPQKKRWYYAIHSPIFGRDGSVSKRQAILIDITKRKLAEKELEEREEYLRKENLRLRTSIKDRYKFCDIIGKSSPMQKVYETILRAASSDAAVIIYGESGTGKELVARAIHEQSERKSRNMVAVNCAAIPESLAESEFFGHKKGAFTGADRDKTGYLEMADGGTLFLDEIGEIKLDLQAKLLRAIEGGGYSPVGGREVIKPDFRIIAATGKDLKTLVRKGKIREDFYFRIHVIPIYIPPLRERREDIPLLVEHFFHQYDPENRAAVNGRTMEALQNYDWPGNVRELQNTLHRYITLKTLDFMGSELTASSHDAGMTEPSPESKDQPLAAVLEQVEKRLILDALNQNQWHREKAARDLGISTRSLYRKMQQYALIK